MKNWKFFILMAILGISMGVFLYKLTGQGGAASQETQSVVEKLPEFSLENLYEGKTPLTDKNIIADQSPIAVVNFWASWCVPCRVEHPQLIKIAQKYNIPVYGINYKEPDKKNAHEFIQRFGNPFKKIGADVKGKTGIEFGVYGIPETFIIDHEGNIIFKHKGPIHENELEGSLKQYLTRE